MTQAGESWALYKPTGFAAFTLKVAQRSAGLVRFACADPRTFIELLRARLVDEERSGRDGQRDLARLVIAYGAPVVFAMLGLFAGIVGLSTDVGPGEWLNGTLFVASLLLLPPILVRDAHRLFEDIDDAVADSLPVAAATHAAARLAHVASHVMPLVLAFVVPATLFAGFALSPWLFVVCPLGLLASLITMVTLLQAIWWILARAFGLRGLRRVSTFTEVALMALLYASAFVMQGAALALPTFVMDVLPTLGPAGFIFPPTQWGALVDLLTGHVSTPNVAHALFALATPVAAMSLALRLARPRGPTLQRASWRWPSERTKPDNGPERAGHGLAAALITRDDAILRLAWPITFGMTIFFAVSMTLVRSFAERGFEDVAHWIVVMFTMFPFGICTLALSAVPLSAHPRGASAFRCIGDEARDAVAVGALRCVLLRVAIPLLALALIAIASYAEWFLVVDALSFALIGVALSTEFMIRIVSFAPFSVREPTMSVALPEHGREPGAPSLGVAGNFGAMAVIMAIVVATHMHPTTRIALAIVAAPFAFNAYRRLGLARTCSVL